MEMILRCLLSLCLLTTPMVRADSNLQSDMQQWLSPGESEELQRALVKLEDWIKITPGSDAAVDESELSIEMGEGEEIPENLLKLLESQWDELLSENERREHILRGDENSVGLLETLSQLSTSDYNKFIFVTLLIYREKPELRPSIAVLNEVLDRFHEAEMAEETQSNSTTAKVVNGAFNGLVLVLTARTVYHLGRLASARWSRSKVGTSMQRAAGPHSSPPSGLLGHSKTPPMATSSHNQLQATRNFPLAPYQPSILTSGLLERARRFLGSRAGILTVHGGGALAGAAWGARQSYLYDLQIHKVSPGLSMDLLQTEVACELSYEAADLRTSSKNLSRSSSPESFLELFEGLQAAQQNLMHLQESKPALADLWVPERETWEQVLQAYEAQLAGEPLAPELSRCQRISTDVIASDLQHTKMNLQTLLPEMQGKLEPEQFQQVEQVLK